MKGDPEAGCVSFSMPHSSKGDEIGASKLASTPAGPGITETTVILRYTSRDDRLQYLGGNVLRNLALYKVESYSSTMQSATEILYYFVELCNVFSELLEIQSKVAIIKAYACDTCICMTTSGAYGRVISEWSLIDSAGHIVSGVGKLE
jgi:hypothetical protein